MMSKFAIKGLVVVPLIFWSFDLSLFNPKANSNPPPPNSALLENIVHMGGEELLTSIKCVMNRALSLQQTEWREYAIHDYNK